jgi:hypothetical protein
MVVRVMHGKVISHFEVENRGRALSVHIDMDSGPTKGEIIATFIGAPAAQGDFDKGADK